jgi:methylmalonyl-CoA mutase
MSTELTLDEFPPVATADWDEAVRRERKGAAPQAKIFYRAEDLRGLEYAGAGKSRTENNWCIRDVVQDAAGARAAMAGGADEICFVLGSQDIQAVLDSLPLDQWTVHFECGARAVELLEALIARPGAPSGSVDFEPLADFDNVAALVRACGWPRFRTMTIRAHRFAEAGATIVQELGWALAEGVEMMAQLTDRGIGAAEAAHALAFSFAAGSQYFPEIAKLRAARRQWARIIESFQISTDDAARMAVYARTSDATTTVYDPHVNMLRATTEAMAAVLGGADAVQVGPFDAVYREPGEASRRWARNTQLILKSEASFDRALDAAAGCYYLESLTDSIARDAWGLLQTVEAAGGFLKYAASGALDREIAKSRAERECAVGTRRAVIVGTNQYPNLQERALECIEREDRSERPARVFEEIRLRTERCAARTGHTPHFLLLESGDAKMRKARSAFAANLFGCAGFETEIAETVTGSPDAIVLCSSDAEYAMLAPRLITELRAAGKPVPVIVAGNPADSEALREAGVADFVHMRSNAAEVLRAWQARLGVE